VISRQAANELSSWLAWTRFETAVSPVPKEDISEPPVFVQPEVIAILAVLLLWRDCCAGSPFATAIEKVTEEENRVWV